MLSVLFGTTNSLPAALLCIGVFLSIYLLVIWWGQQYINREQFLKTIQQLAEKGSDEIHGQLLEECLDILNQDTTQTLTPNDSMVLTLKDEVFFFVDGKIVYAIFSPRNYLDSHSSNVFFLIAVGPSAVDLLSEHKKIFRKIAGSTDLAAFSIYRWSEFTKMLLEKKCT